MNDKEIYIAGEVGSMLSMAYNLAIASTKRESSLEADSFYRKC